MQSGTDFFFTSILMKLRMILTVGVLLISKMGILIFLIEVISKQIFSVWRFLVLSSFC